MVCFCALRECRGKLEPCRCGIKHGRGCTGPGQVNEMLFVALTLSLSLAVQAVSGQSLKDVQKISDNPGSSAHVSKSALPERVSQFVATRGTQFSTGERRLYFSGTNADYLLQPNDTQIADVKKFIKASAVNGVNVIRISGRRAGDVTQQQANAAAGQSLYSQEDAVRLLDKVIVTSAKYGVYVIVPLTTFWTGSLDDSFFTEEDVKQQFQQHIHALLNHRNVYSDVAYADTPAIFAWELAEEPQTSLAEPNKAELLTKWIDEMAAFVKGIDDKHLVGTGEDGHSRNWRGATGNRTWEDDRLAAEAFTNHIASPNIDFASVHLYPGETDSSLKGGDFGEYLLKSRAQIAHSLGKPILLEEIGTQAGDRNTVLEKYFTVANAEGYAGTLVWQLVGNPPGVVNASVYNFDWNTSGSRAIRRQASILSGMSDGPSQCSQSDAQEVGDALGSGNGAESCVDEPHLVAASFSCAEGAALGRCTEDWMAAVCRRTCGRCTPQPGRGSPAAGSAISRTQQPQACDTNNDCPLNSCCSTSGVCTQQTVDASGKQLCPNCNAFNGARCPNSRSLCCPSGACVANVTGCPCATFSDCPSYSCCGKRSFCTQTPVNVSSGVQLCPNCQTSFNGLSCPLSLPFCCPNGKCAASLTACTCGAVSTCPAFSCCNNFGLCTLTPVVGTTQVCPNCRNFNGVSCPFATPVCCGDGRCVASVTQCSCSTSTDCPANSCCAASGFCTQEAVRADLTQVCLNCNNFNGLLCLSPNAVCCPNGRCVANVGQCACASNSDCPSLSCCSATGFCTQTPFAKTQVCTNCNAFNGLNCPRTVPVCCPRGQCAANVSSCICASDADCPSYYCCSRNGFCTQSPVDASGVQVCQNCNAFNGLACPSPMTCCKSGKCVASPLSCQCSSSADCPYKTCCSSVSGTCTVDVANPAGEIVCTDCTQLNGLQCPTSTPYCCPGNGACVADPTVCPCNPSAANRCPPGFGCPDGNYCAPPATLAAVSDANATASMLGWTNNGYSDAAFFVFTSKNATAAGLPAASVDFAEFTYVTLTMGKNLTCTSSRNTGVQTSTCTSPAGVHTSQTNPYTGITTVTFTSPGLATPMVITVNPDNSWSSTLPNGTVIGGPDFSALPRPPPLRAQPNAPGFDAIAGFRTLESVFLDWRHVRSPQGVEGLAGLLARFACSCDDTYLSDLCQHEVVQLEAVLTICAGLYSFCWALSPVPMVAAACGVNVGVCTVTVGVLMYVCAKRFNPCPPDQCKPLCRGPSSDYDFCDSDYPG
eukprot:jgi/Botrbrau1/21857/Bobra.0190s0068.1